MEMLIFFVISLIGGVLAGYFSEKFHKSEGNYYKYRNKQSTESIMNRLMKITRQLN